MALNSFGQSSPLMAFSENRSPSNGSGPDSGRKYNGLKRMTPTPPQMYTTDAPMANEEFTGTTTVNSSPTKIPISGRSNDIEKAATNGRNANSNAMIRKKGLPWVLCSMVCVIFLLLIFIAYLLFRIYGDDQQSEYWSSIPPSNSTPIPSSSLLASSSSFSPSTQKSMTPSPQTRMTTQSTSTTTQQENLIENLAPIWPKLDEQKGSVETRFSKAAIASENALCSEIGRNVLLKGGNAVDAAISVSICIGALNSHSSGLGGGFLMTYYQRFYGKCTSIDARETAPFRTDKNIFNANKTEAKFGYKAVAVPGEVHGFWTAFKRFGSGKIAWMDLLMPTVNLLNEGFPASKLLETNLKYFEEKILNGTFPGMRSQFVNPSTGNLFKEGEIVRNPILADTLKRLALSHDPVQLFYSANGEIARSIVEEFGQNDGFLSRKDLHTYRSIVDEHPLLNTEADPKLIFCGPKPSSGFAVTQLIMAIMLKFYPLNSNSSIPWNSLEFWHRLIEAEKFAYAMRTKLGDKNFVKNSEQLAMEMTKAEFVQKIWQKIGPNALNQMEYLMDGKGKIETMAEDGGTSQVLVIDADGNAVSMTNSINRPFGSLVRSPRLGIVWNNHMADFNLPDLANTSQGFVQPSANFIEPGKRPMSSMSPIIAYDRETKKVKLAIGASGGPKIPSAIAQVLVQMLSFGHGPKEAIDSRRIHNQFTPISSQFEAEFPKLILDALQGRGQQMVPFSFPFSFVQAIIARDGHSTSARDQQGSKEILIASNDGRRQIHSQPIGY